ncbi:MAG TPA: poly-beta-1,6-N-acetyl-D-glucosamine synthase [Micropepsaceae bacterium]|nr:poly-beta-1,6-N-acetyl-D-glucosamine synthase [Micropepsaceae bacterium]
MSDQFLSVIVVGLIVGTIGAFQALQDFIFFYPLFMSFIWTFGAIYYYFHWEREAQMPDSPPVLSSAPMVSIVVPCFNEEANVRETIQSLVSQNYPHFEVVAVNDGSRDRTAAILDELCSLYPALRVIHFAQNQGKGLALRMGVLAARAEFIVCIDGDSILHPNATGYLVQPMIDNPRVGAITGNPRIRTRSSLIGRIQVGEFSSIVGMIKRAQRIYGRIFTVSGVVTAFRKQALHRVGYWSLNMVTEDIDVSWQLQRDHWGIMYAPNALCWILMPETLHGLWRQRLRWAQGGAEVCLKNIGSLWRWRLRRMWPLLFEYCISVAWAFAFVLTVALWFIGKFAYLPPGMHVDTIFPPAFTGLVLGTTCLLQFAASVIIESRYEPRLWRQIVWTIWYPTAYWAIIAATSVVGFPKALAKRRSLRAAWVSPDRGIRPS